MAIERPLADDEPNGLPVARPVRWTVWRQDDNGNRFEVAGRTRVRRPAALAAAMQVRGHKQTYCVARATR